MRYRSYFDPNRIIDTDAADPASARPYFSRDTDLPPGGADLGFGPLPFGGALPPSASPPSGATDLARLLASFGGRPVPQQPSVPSFEDAARFLLQGVPLPDMPGGRGAPDVFSRLQALFTQLNASEGYPRDQIEKKQLQDPRGNIRGTNIPDRGQPEDHTQSEELRTDEPDEDLRAWFRPDGQMDRRMELPPIPQDYPPRPRPPAPLRRTVR